MNSMAFLEKIIGLAVSAPSGDNAQPWRFEAKGNELHIYNVRNDTMVYNFRERGSYIAHGALIENIIIASSQMGHHPNIILFPERGNDDFIARITFRPAAPADDPLYPFITVRATNRKPYKDVRLSAEQKEILLSTPQEIGKGGRVLLVEEKQKKEELAYAISRCDRFLFENRAIHDFLFAHVNWTEKEEREKRSGLYAKTLELAPPQLTVFKLFHNWRVAQVLSAIGLPKFIAKENAKLYRTSSAIGVIIKGGETNGDFVIMGRIMQRMWLHITKLGLSMQPITASVYLAQRIFAGDTEAFSDEQVSIIKETNRQIKEIFGIGGDTIGLIFRVGDGGAPSARSLRLFPDIKTL